jgi:AAA domain
VPFHDLRPGPEPLYLVDELIPVAGLVDVWGKAKCYKSFWCLDLMLHVAMGWEYRDRYVRQGVVVYCAFEGAHGYKKRIEALRRHYDIANDTPVPLHVMPGQANLIAEHTVLISDIAEQLDDVCPAAVVLDTLNKSLFGSENKDVDMGAYVRAAEAIRDAFGCVVIIIHHCGYDDTRPRGHSSLPGAVDAQLAVTRTEEVITVTVEMMRDGPEDTQVVSEAEVVEVGQDQNGKTLTSLAVIPSDADAATREHQGWPRRLSVFHAALKFALTHHGEAFQPEAGVLPVRAVCLWPVRERFYITYAEAEENTEKRQNKLRQAFNRALGDAQRSGVIRVMQTGAGQTMVWLPVRGES